MSKVLPEMKSARALLGCALTAAGGIGFLVLMSSGGAADPPAPPVSGSASAIHPSLADFDKTKVKGADSCKKCHASEHAAWSKSVHFKNHERVSSNAGKEYAEKAGGTDACNACHSTPHGPDAQFSGTAGVSCESCHSPAGGDAGWFDVHSNYGGEGVKREEESEAHLKERLAACDAAGMIHPANLHDLASNCYSCHIVTNEDVLKAGHKSGQSDFELVGWMQGEVRHNFQVDQKTNAESPSLLNARTGIDSDQRKRMVLVVGRMVELETCLRALSTASDLKARYAGSRGWAGRAEDAYDYLADDIGKLVDNQHVKAAVAAVDFDLGRKFEDQAAAKVAADKLAQIAKDFSASAADADLAALDKLVDKVSKPKGEVYTP